MKSYSLPHMALADLSQQLALLLHAGVGLANGLHLLADQESDPKIYAMLSNAASQVDMGSTLWAAFEQAQCFPTHAVHLLHVGEESGRLEETLMALSHYYEEKELRQRQLRSALTYPAILILTMLVVIVVLLSQVLPVFQQVYASLGGSLTGIAAGFLSIGNGLRVLLPYLTAVMAIMVLMGILCCTVPCLQIRCQRLWHNALGDRGILRKQHEAHFAQALSMAYSSGMPLEDGIALASALLEDSPHAKQRCQNCCALLDEGKDLAAALQETQLLPSTACRILALGLQAGTGDVALEEISRRLAREAQEALEQKMSMIEPTLVMITSLLVGAILLSVMLPLMNIMKAIG